MLELLPSSASLLTLAECRGREGRLSIRRIYLLSPGPRQRVKTVGRKKPLIFHSPQQSPRARGAPVDAASAFSLIYNTTCRASLRSLAQEHARRPTPTVRPRLRDSDATRTNTMGCDGGNCGGTPSVIFGYVGTAILLKFLFGIDDVVWLAPFMMYFSIVVSLHFCWWQFILGTTIGAICIATALGTCLWCSPRLADKVASLPLVPVVVIMAIYISVQAFVPAMNPSPRNSAGAC
jgi:hypothetical protein